LRSIKMRKHLIVFSVMTLVVLLVFSATPAKAGNPTFKLLNPPPKNKPFELAVGESHTFFVKVTSDEPFISAIALTNEYYPGRGIFWHGSDRATRNTSAVLELTITGKEPTAGLSAVCDWPEPGDCWPEGVAPVAIAVGVRYERGEVIGEQSPFAVEVP
jgi:hypothetical protein